jgi:hypothetical protein
MKFYLLQRGDSHNENTLHAFDTAEARDAKTKELIYGDGELCPDEQRGLGLYLEELRDSGSVEFEGDPGLEWFTAHPA